MSGGYGSDRGGSVFNSFMKGERWLFIPYAVEAMHIEVSENHLFDSRFHLRP
jgi:hypothetical protein